jgi:hypothetical protein
LTPRLLSSILRCELGSRNRLPKTGLLIKCVKQPNTHPIKRMHSKHQISEPGNRISNKTNKSPLVLNIFQRLFVLIEDFIVVKNQNQLCRDLYDVFDDLK